MTGGVTRIVEQLGDYEPPFDVAATVRRLLDSVPPSRLAGLGSVVLTTSGALSSRSRKQVYRYRSGERVRIGDSPAHYQPGWKSQRPYVALLLDNLLDGWRFGVLRWPLFRDMVVGRCLYHEIGHHLHATQRPDRQDGELVAERWRAHLFGLHWRRHYRYLRPLWPLIRRVWLWAAPAS